METRRRNCISFLFLVGFWIASPVCGQTLKVSSGGATQHAINFKNTHHEKFNKNIKQFVKDFRPPKGNIIVGFSTNIPTKKDVVSEEIFYVNAKGWKTENPQNAVAVRVRVRLESGAQLPPPKYPPPKKADFRLNYKGEYAGSLILRYKSTGDDTSSTKKNDSRFYQAAIIHPNGKAYFFRGSRYARFDFRSDRVDKVGTIQRDGWREVPDDVDAAVGHPRGKAYFFKGTKYYRFDYAKDRLDKTGDIGSSGWPGVPTHLDGAVYHPSGKVYFFKGQKYYRFDLPTNRVEKVATIGTDGWRGVPGFIDAVVHHPNKKVYFFKARRYYRFDMKTNRVDKTGIVSHSGWKGL